MFPCRDGNAKQEICHVSSQAWPGEYCVSPLSELIGSICKRRTGHHGTRSLQVYGKGTGDGGEDAATLLCVFRRQPCAHSEPVGKLQSHVCSSGELLWLQFGLT